MFLECPWAVKGTLSPWNLCGPEQEVIHPTWCQMLQDCCGHTEKWKHPKLSPPGSRDPLGDLLAWFSLEPFCPAPMYTVAPVPSHLHNQDGVSALPFTKNHFMMIL